MHFPTFADYDFLSDISILTRVTGSNGIAVPVIAVMVNFKSSNAGFYLFLYGLDNRLGTLRPLSRKPLQRLSNDFGS
jgi:hypothetical protein